MDTPLIELTKGHFLDVLGIALTSSRLTTPPERAHSEPMVSRSHRVAIRADEAKFRANATRATSEKQADRIAETVFRLDTFEDIRELVSACIVREGGSIWR